MNRLRPPASRPRPATATLPLLDARSVTRSVTRSVALSVARSVTLSVTLLLAVAPAGRAQDPRAVAAVDSTARPPAGRTLALKLRDGSTLYGREIRVGNDSVVIQGITGRLALQRSDVREIADAGAAHAVGNGAVEYWFENPNSTRMLFGPSGRTLRQGEGYVGVHLLFLGSVAVGVTDWFTIGAGTFIIPSSELWVLMPKIALYRGASWNLALGAIGGSWGRNEVGGIAYLAGTYGSLDHSLTVGLGRPFSSKTLSSSTTVMLGTEQRMSRRTSFVSENYIFPGGDLSLISYGVRFFGEKVAVDLAFLNNPSQLFFPGLPYLAFVFKF